MLFKDFNFSRTLLTLILELGYKNVYPIQAKAIPLILDKKDVLGIAKTGSGKTASYVLPIISSIVQPKKSPNRHISILVVVPTRELAIQISDVFIYFKKGADRDLAVKSVYGGVSINPQMKAMKGVDILVATPGRLLDLVESNAVHLSKVKIFVLDEADKMLGLGFEEEMNRIFSLLPKNKQSLLFSATLSEDIDKLSKLHLQEPVIININKGIQNKILIKQKSYIVTEKRKGPLLRYLIKNNEMQQVLIFASSTYQVKHITNKLNKNGIKASAFYGKKSQSSRTLTLKQFKDGKINVLVATDILARGIDIIKLPIVINYELPRSPKDYIHRIGRTGRADSKGEVISLITKKDLNHFKVIQKKIGQRFELIETGDLELNGY